MQFDLTWTRCGCDWCKVERSEEVINPSEGDRHSQGHRNIADRVVIGCVNIARLRCVKSNAASEAVGLQISRGLELVEIS